MTNSTLSQDAIVIERIFDAPLERVWQLWTQAEHFQQWYGPKGFTVPVALMDLRVGGKRLICMEGQTPKGSMRMWTTGEYTEIVPQQRLVYTESPSDEHGNALPPEAVGMPEGYPATTEITVQLEEINGRTRMVMTHAGLPAASGATSGWTQAFDKLEAYLKVA